MFELVDRSSPSDLNTNSPPVREASFDLIELSTPASTALDFDAAALNIATSLLEEDDMEYQITEHHGVCLLQRSMCVVLTPLHRSSAGITSLSSASRGSLEQSKRGGGQEPPKVTSRGRRR